MGKQRDKGTRAETAVVGYLRSQGVGAYRMALHGSADQGDVGGVELGGVPVCLEVKSCARYEIPEWLREARREAENSRSGYAAVVMKPNGVGTAHPERFWCVLTLEDFARILKEDSTS